MTRAENEARIQALCRHDLEVEAMEAFDRFNNPEIADFMLGVGLEAIHQRQCWGAAADREKSAEHWYWLVGYLAGKANRSHIEGNLDKARHHTISSAAALFHWHDAISQDLTGHGLGRDTDLAKRDQPVQP